MLISGRFQRSGKNGLALIFRAWGNSLSFFFPVRRGFHCLSESKSECPGYPPIRGGGGLGFLNDWCIIKQLVEGNGYETRQTSQKQLFVMVVASSRDHDPFTHR